MKRRSVTKNFDKEENAGGGPMKKKRNSAVKASSEYNSSNMSVSVDSEGDSQINADDLN